MSKEGGEKKQNSIILTYAGEKKDGERFNIQEDSVEEINFANVAQVQSNEPNRENQEIMIFIDRDI